MSTFSERLRECRREKKWTQDQFLIEFQELTGATLSKVSLARYETGVRNPDIDIATKLANTLNVDLNYLVGNTNIKNQIKKK